MKKTYSVYPKDLESSSLHSTMSVKDYIIHRLTACVVRYRSLLLYSTPHVVRSEWCISEREISLFIRRTYYWWTENRAFIAWWHQLIESILKRWNTLETIVASMLENMTLLQHSRLTECAFRFTYSKASACRHPCLSDRIENKSSPTHERIPRKIKRFPDVKGRTIDDKYAAKRSIITECSDLNYRSKQHYMENENKRFFFKLLPVAMRWQNRAEAHTA